MASLILRYGVISKRSPLDFPISLERISVLETAFMQVLTGIWSLIIKYKCARSYCENYSHIYDFLIKNIDTSFRIASYIFVFLLLKRSRIISIFLAPNICDDIGKSGVCLEWPPSTKAIDFKILFFCVTHDAD